MAEEGPNFDLPEVDDRDKGFPWILVILAVVVLILVAGWWFHRQPQHQGHNTAIAALDQQLNTDRAALEAERNKVIEMTTQLDALKQKIMATPAKARKELVAQYNILAAEQRAQREKVKGLAALYNQKVADLRKVEQQ